MPGSSGHFHIFPRLNENKQIKPTFKKNERLKSRSTILKLFSQNQSKRIYPIKIVWNIEACPEGFTPKIGVSVSKRNFKHAVQRNRIKRQMREAFRLNKHLLYESLQEHNIQLTCMIIYSSPQKIDYSEIETKVKQCLLQLNKTMLKRVKDI